MEEWTEPVLSTSASLSTGSVEGMKEWEIRILSFITAEYELENEI